MNSRTYLIYLNLIISSIFLFPISTQAKPKNITEGLYFGMGYGVSSTLCDLTINGVLTESMGNEFIYNYFQPGLTNGDYNLLGQTKDGFNAAVDVINDQDGENCKLKVY